MASCPPTGTREVHSSTAEVPVYIGTDQTKLQSGQLKEATGSPGTAISFELPLDARTCAGTSRSLNY